jgi:hypothetical protein
MTTLLDTGPLVAYLYEGDTHHEWSKKQAARISMASGGAREGLVEPRTFVWGVSTEARRRGDPGLAP